VYATNNGFSQSIDYRYNIRGWLTNINNSDLVDDGGVTNNDANDFFGFELKYNDPTSSGGTAQFNGNISESQWKIMGGQKQAFGYMYDPLNRITSSTFSNIDNPLDNGKFNEKGLQYDRNGNIQYLNRNGRQDASQIGVTQYGPMDQLQYTYNGNQLTSVTDSAPNTTSTEGGFIDGNTNGYDYSYDANGNLTVDNNKSITGVTYNYLNLPILVTKSSGEKIQYTYDATGIKLNQTVTQIDPNDPNNLITTKTEYSSGMVYDEKGNLQFINHDEGRIIMTGSTPEYQYHLKDHLGNVRLTFTTQSSKDFTTATFETVNTPVERSEFLRFDDIRIINAKVFDHTQYAQPNQAYQTNYSERLNGTANEQHGVARSLSVMPGDTLDLEVWGKYLSANIKDPNLASLINSVNNGIAGVGVVVDGSTYATATGNLFLFNDGFLNKSDDTDPGPKAFLNYLVFDRDYNHIKAKSGYIKLSDKPAEDGTGVPFEQLTARIIIDQPGYVYAYLSNDNVSLGGNIVEVYFDDFKVTHRKSQIVQTNDYYALGVSFNSYQRENSLVNNYRYNGKELINVLGLGWYDYGARMYMPEIGRWGVIDPSSENYSSWTSYNYCAYNPLRLIDPTGTDWFYYDDSWNWHEGTTLTRPVDGLLDEDGNQYYQVLQGEKAVVVFNGSRDETLASDGTFTSDGAVSASVTVYGPDGKDDVHTYTGYTMTSNADTYTPVDEGVYVIQRREDGGSSSIPKNYYVKNAGNPESDQLRTMNGAINNNAPLQLSSNGEGYKTEIFVHGTATSGFAGVYPNGSKISSGCLLINSTDYNGTSGFNSVLTTVGNGVNFMLILNRVGSDHNPTPSNTTIRTYH
jgi:RHS repeat-associated protein